MDDKITIIEGPPPTFEVVNDGWSLGLNETPNLYAIALTRLRTYNGPSLVERCYRAWSNRTMIQLEYRSSDGLLEEAPILAIRNIETEEGQMIILWVRQESHSFEKEADIDDDLGEDFDDDFGIPGM